MDFLHSESKTSYALYESAPALLLAIQGHPRAISARALDFKVLRVKLLGASAAAWCLQGVDTLSFFEAMARSQHVVTTATDSATSQLLLRT